MKRVHFIGIGGIGLSALALFMKEKKYIISGSDLYPSEITKSLEKEGITIYTPHTQDSIDENIDMVIYSAAIKYDNIELVKARKLGIKVYSRNEALKMILDEKLVYAVAGAHGKSTTSAIFAHIISSSFILGAIDKKYQKNMVYKKNTPIVFEADESDGSFLNSNPYLCIITNAEPEHMEFYKYDLNRFYKAYEKFLLSSKIRVINAEDEFLSRFEDDAVRLYPSRDITEFRFFVDNGYPKISFKLKDLGVFECFGMGFHIAIDASLAILAAYHIGYDLEEIKNGLKEFCGIKKRFDILKTSGDFVLIDDYAHHPTEIDATLKSVKQYANALGINDIKVVWQPHKYTRLIQNLDGFKRVLNGNDLYVTNVYSAFEKHQDINLKEHFDGELIEDVKRYENHLEFITNNGVKKIEKGIVICFNAGDLSHKIREVLS